jgi:hypothetical protein
MRDVRDIWPVVVAALAAIVLFSTHRTKGFPALQRSHIYRVTVELEPGKTDEDVQAMMSELKKAYGETWVDWSRLDETHIQWSFMADQDQPAPTNIPREWADKTTVDDLGPRVIV